MSFRTVKVDPAINIAGYKILEKLGSGSYSTVYKASKLDGENDHQYVAIKCISKASLSASGRDNIVNEIKIMKLLQHQFIVRLLDFQWDDKYVYLILEYCAAGDLSSFIKWRRRLAERVFHKFFQQLVIGLKFLRSHNVSHFDLKPKNLLLAKCPKLTLKIADFGFAQFLSEDCLKSSLRGSPLYMAPEILLRRETSVKADLWSLGVISYECLFGRPPFHYTTVDDIIKNHQNQLPLEIPKNVVSSDCVDLLSRLLVYEPRVRMDFDELFSHSFLDLEHYPTEESYVKGVSLVHRAVELDYDKNYTEAFKVYCQALQYLVPYVKETDMEDEVKRASLQKKVLEYTNRAEDLKRNFVCKELTAAGLPDNTGSEQSADRLANSPTLISLCSSTTSLMSGLEMGRVGYMYLAEGKYTEALDKLTSALSTVIPVMQSEPPGLRKDLLVKQVQDWLKAAENIKVLLSVKKTDDQILECSDGCVVQ